MPDLLMILLYIVFFGVGLAALYLASKISLSYSFYKNKLYFWIGCYLFAFIVHSLYTGYFGWNWQAVNAKEKLLDRSVEIMLILSFLGVFRAFLAYQFKLADDQNRGATK
ncbi:hypothetical protein P4475_02740 [Halalkalibacterium halodurans]|uniref:hypothetical protein n=1 Tax=Halalkalibacterium halodurans TaxID=86665 RepID=UPI002E20CE03|nr:hypothetical protein [Halalkalibacterium halodurans]